MTKLNTGERLVKIETKMEVMHDSITEIKEMLKEHVDWEAKKYEELDSKYASKLTEKIVYGLVGLTLSGIVTAAIMIII